LQTLPELLRKLVAALGIGAVAALIVVLLHAEGGLDTAELKAYDWRVRQTADRLGASHDIALIEITDASIRDLSQVFGHWPWPRLAYSYALDFLRRAPAKVVAIDLIFAEPDTVAQYDLNGDKVTGAESDRALADSVKASGNVVLLADAVSEGLVGGSDITSSATWRDPGYHLGPRIEERPVILPPLQPLRDAAAGLGHNFLVFDGDGPARRMPPFVRNGAHFLPSLGIAAALQAGGFKPEDVSLDGDAIRVRDRRIPLVPLQVKNARDPSKTHDQLTMLIDYRAPALPDGSSPYPRYELRHILKSEDLLLSGEKPLVDPVVFKDKIVFIGLKASGLGDVFVTPFGSTGRVPGIEVHASMADSLLANRFIRPASAASRIGALLVAATGVGLFSAFLPFTAAAAATAAVLSGWIWLTLGAFRQGLWLNLVEPVSAGAIALFAGTTYRYFVEDREKRKVRKLFSRYVSKDVYAELLAHPERAELGGVRREMSVLFSDIRGFTSVSEQGDAEAIVGQLNEYFATMVEVVFRHGGTVDKFVGDMVMALFGAPLDDVDHAEHAVETAVDMVQALGELNRRWAQEGRPQLDIGVGINSGDMIAGNIGSSSIMSYTVIGDNVNLGSRLESLNKEYRTRIIISDATRSSLKGDYLTRSLGDVIVKGKTRPVSIHEVVVPTPLVAREEHT
jgi:adenylate cyclase